MANKNKCFQGILPKIEQEFANLQFEQAIETLRAQASLLTQMIVVLVIANATLIGYAIGTQISGFLFIGPLFSFMILHLTNVMFKAAIPILYIAVSIEGRYGGCQGDWGVSAFLSTLYSPDYVAELRKIDSIQDPVKKFRQLRNISLPQRLSITRIVFFLLALGQVVAPLILYYFFGWRLI